MQANALVTMFSSEISKAEDAAQQMQQQMSNAASEEEKKDFAEDHEDALMAVAKLQDRVDIINNVLASPIDRSRHICYIDVNHLCSRYTD